MALCSVALLSGCGSDDINDVGSTVGTDSDPATSDPSTSGSTLNPVAGSWRLTAAVLEGDMAIPIPPESVPTMTITGTQIDVYFGCNSGGGTVTYDIDGNSFSVADLAQTEMACPGEQMAIEQAVSTVLGNATTYSSSPGSLSISDGNEFPSSLDFEIADS